MTSRKSQVKGQNSKHAIFDLRPSTSSLQPETCDFRLATNRFAFTLIEMVVSIVILAIVAGITTHYLVSASQLYTLLLARKQADSEVMDAANRMRREVRLLRETLAAGSNEWSFCNTENKTNTFILSGTDVNLNSHRLAAGINRFALNYYDATNGLLGPLPLVATNRARIKRVALDIKATNNLADSELKVNFFLQEDMLK
ncbi:MAG: prepilin-type N-terminal cleavage/methylation domain-containing protein [Kiritimatiellia bacterium]|nr:prepilin-type N-terminal cleavage/methylation domain-containing protein [Kiritimatiellia bacterium]